MTRRAQVDDVRLPGEEQPIAPVTIFDGEGRVLRVVPAAELRRPARIDPGGIGRSWRRAKKSR